MRLVRAAGNFTLISLQQRNATMARARSTRIVGLIAGMMFSGLPMSLHAQQPGPVLCFDELVSRNWCELEQIYRQAKPGKIPLGFARGQVIYCENELLAHCKTRMARLLWHGKHFGCDGMLVNQWTGVRAIRAKVYYGPSCSTVNRPSSSTTPAPRASGMTCVMKCVRSLRASISGPCTGVIARARS